MSESVCGVGGVSEERTRERKANRGKKGTRTNGEESSLCIHEVNANEPLM